MDSVKCPRGYVEDFDADWFLENYIKTLKEQRKHGGIMPFALEFLHDTFATGKYKANKLLDVGTGPTVHTVISASRYVKEIHLSDIGARNREILQNWLEGEDYIQEIFEYITGKENDGTPLKDRMNEVRSKVTKVYEIDLRSPRPLPDSSGMYDMIIASLVLGAVAKDKADYIQTLKKVTDMIKPEGYLVVIGALNSTFYKVGHYQFSSSGIDRGEMKNIFINEGLKINEWRETEPGKYLPGHVEKSFSDEQGLFGMIAQKPAQA